MYKVAGWWVLYLNHMKHADVTPEDDFDFLRRFVGCTYVADGTCAEMEAMAKLLNGGLTNVS